MNRFIGQHLALPTHYIAKEDDTGNVLDNKSKSPNCFLLPAAEQDREMSSGCKLFYGVIDEGKIYFGIIPFIIARYKCIKAKPSVKLGIRNINYWVRSQCICALESEIRSLTE